MKIWGIAPTVCCSAVFLLLGPKKSRMWLWARHSLLCTASEFVTWLCCLSVSELHNCCLRLPLNWGQWHCAWPCWALGLPKPSQRHSLSHLSHWAYRDGNTGLLVEISLCSQNPPALARQHSNCWEYSLGCWSGGLWFSFSFFVLPNICFLFHTVSCNIL